LPTEAEWEYACRARARTAYCFGDDQSKLGDYAWFHDNASNAGRQNAQQVGQKTANPWGLCDMHGNVNELCRDRYTEKLPGGVDPEAKEGTDRVYRGGSWGDDASRCRSASRYYRVPPDRGFFFLGFRPVLSAVR
jgi:formylglycine-generating enzyme required for sulfatase activity